MSGMDMKLKKRMDMGEEVMGTTSDDCYASDTTWLQTLAYCFQQHCNADGASEADVENAWGLLAANGVDVPSYQSSIPATIPTEELASDAVWLNSTSLVNGETYFSYHQTLAEFEFQEDMHVRTSYVDVLLFEAMHLKLICTFQYRSNCSHGSSMLACSRFQSTQGLQPWPMGTSSPFETLAPASTVQWKTPGAASSG